MGVAAKAPRGGLVERLAPDGPERVLILRNGELERFEDQHGSIFQTYDGFMGRAPKPTSRVVRDLVALGLIGGGMADKDADALAEAGSPEVLVRFYAIAQALIGTAFLPDLAAGQDQGKDKGKDKDGGTDEQAKKPDPAAGMFAG